MNKQMTLDDVLKATLGTLLSEGAKVFDGVGTDTRTSLSNKLFVALKGEAFDAHNFVEKAISAGATGLLIHQWQPSLESFKTKISIVLVNDTLLALQQLGQYRRRQWGKTLVAITGSNGKTTTKEFTAQIISKFKSVHFNQGSFNNHWGVPLTLLGLQPEHEVAICEMGMNHPGEITNLVKLAEPNIAGITMVGRAHLEGLGTIEAVALAKEEIFSPENRELEWGIFNLDNTWTSKAYEKHKGQIRKHLTFSAVNPKADVQFQIVSMTLDNLKIRGLIHGQRGEAQIEVFGQHNLNNLMFAACAALAAGLSPSQIWEGLPNCKTTWGRNQKLSHSSGSDILFDGYNANPDSQKALLENLKQMTLNRPLIGIFGEMKELGVQSAALHEELGALVATVPFDQVYFVGHFGGSFKTGFVRQLKLTHFATHLILFSDVNADMLTALNRHLPERPLITIKGSRGVRLERLLEQLDITV